MFSFVIVNQNLLFRKNQIKINKSTVNMEIQNKNKFNNDKYRISYDKKIINMEKSLRKFYCLIDKFQFSKNFINFSAFYFTKNSILIDTSKLNIKQEDIINENFLFSTKTTQPSDIEAEIEEIEDDEYRYRTWKNTQIGLALGGSAVGMWFAYKGLNLWEKWMKEQEQKDIEEEIQMTGTYINPGAGNVEISIDPITGKKIQIKPSKIDPSSN